MGGGAGALPPFCLFAGKECRAIRELGVETRPARGGAMGTTNEQDGEAGKGIARRKSNPEKGSKLPVVFLREAANTAFETNVLQIMNCILGNIERGDLPNAKFLVDVVQLMKRGDEVPAEAYESLAEVLWKECQELEKQGQGVTAKD